MNIYRYYININLYPFLVAAFITTLFMYNVNKDYKSEWLTAESVVMFSMMTTFFYGFLFAIITATIFLNKWRPVQQNRLLTFLSWFLLPLVFMISMFIISMRSPSGDEMGRTELMIFLLLIIVPYLFALVYNYLKFRRQPQPGS